MENLIYYRSLKTKDDMLQLEKSDLKEGEICYCCEDGIEYRFLNGVWGVNEKNEKVIERETVPVYQFPVFKNIRFTDNSIQIVRKDGTKAMEICLDENENSSIIFYDKEGKSLGVMNQELFQ